jgi:hypothetical protein
MGLQGISFVVVSLALVAMVSSLVVVMAALVAFSLKIHILHTSIQLWAKRIFLH